MLIVQRLSTMSPAHSMFARYIDMGLPMPFSPIETGYDTIQIASAAAEIGESRRQMIEAMNPKQEGDLHYPLWPFWSYQMEVQHL